MKGSNGGLSLLMSLLLAFSGFNFSQVALASEQDSARLTEFNQLEESVASQNPDDGADISDEQLTDNSKATVETVEKVEAPDKEMEETVEEAEDEDSEAEDDAIASDEETASVEAEAESADATDEAAETVETVESALITVTFKVINGYWDDGTTEDKTVTLTGLDSNELKLEAEQIPAVGSKPCDNTYMPGSWDKTPDVDASITEAITYTYTYEAKKAAVVIKAPEAKKLIYVDEAQ